MLSYVETFARALVPGFARSGPATKSEDGLALSIAAYKLVSATLTGVNSAVASVRRWRERRDAIRVLSALDDRTLRDIGVDRYSIPEVVDGVLASRAPRARNVDESEDALAA